MPGGGRLLRVLPMRLPPIPGLRYRRCMCKPISDYLGLMRDYTREIITFGGLCLMCIVYGDFKTLAQEQSATAAQTVDVLRAMDSRLMNIEHDLAK